MRYGVRVRATFAMNLEQKDIRGLVNGTLGICVSTFITLLASVPLFIGAKTAIAEETNKGSARLVSGARAFKQIAHREFVGGAQTYLYQELEPRFTDVTLKALPNGQSIKLPDGEFIVTYAISGGAAIASRMCVVVGISMDGKNVKSVPVWFETSAKAKGLITKSAMSSGAVLNRELVTEAFVDAVRATDNISLIDIENFRLKRDVTAGEALNLQVIERLLPVLKGQIVTIRVLDSNIALEMSAIALEGGNMGSIVHVRRESGGESLRTRVIGSGVVTLDGV